MFFQELHLTFIVVPNDVSFPFSIRPALLALDLEYDEAAHILHVKHLVIEVEILFVIFA
jgi:hypothetical protein